TRRSLHISVPSPRAEFEIDASAEDVFVEAHNGARGTSAIRHRRASAVWQVDEKVFDLARPILGEGVFKPGADRPSGYDRAGESGWCIDPGLNIAEAGAGGTEDENAIEGITNAPANRNEPLALGLTTHRRRYDRRNNSASRARVTSKIAPIAIAFNAK